MDLVGAELVVHQPGEGNGVAEELLASDGVVEQDHGCKDQEHILQDAGHGEDDGGRFADLVNSKVSRAPCKGTRGQTYQENTRNVQKEGHKGVCKQNHRPKTVDICHGQAGQLDDGSEQAVRHRTRGGKVVERDQRVHLEVARAQQALDQDKTQGLKDDTADLEHEAAEDELDLAEGGDHDTQDDDGDVPENLDVGWCDAECPCGQEGRHGGGSLSSGGILSTNRFFRVDTGETQHGTHLQHLDKRHTQCQVGQVAAHQTQAEHDAYGYYCAPARYNRGISSCPLQSSSSGPAHVALTHMYAVSLGRYVSSRGSW